MNEINSVTTRPAGVPVQIEPTKSDREAQRETHRAATPGEDRVELSQAAVEYDPQVEADRAMETRIASVRAEIAAGTYLTDEKINAVVDKLYKQLVGG